MVDWFQLTAVAAGGGAGTSAADTTSTTCVAGIVRAVEVKFHGSTAGATLVTTIKTSGTHAPSYNILVLTDTATDTIKYPTAIAQDTTGANVTFDGTHTVRVPLAVDDHIELVLAGANVGDTVDVFLLLE